MEVIRKMSGSNKEFKERFKEAQQQDKIHTTIEERKKSANQRDLERHFKEQDEARIKAALEKINKKRTKDSWKSEHQILAKGKSILADDRPILKEKNLFKGKGNSLHMRGSLKGETKSMTVKKGRSHFR